MLCHVYPLRAWCNARVVCSRPSARDSRSISRAMRPSTQTLLRIRYTLFCIFRWRRLPRSTALEVAGNNVSSRNVRAFSRCGEKTFFLANPGEPVDPLPQLLQLAQGRLRPATPVKQRIKALIMAPATPAADISGEEPNSLRQKEFVDSIRYSEWPKAADTVSEAPLSTSCRADLFDCKRNIMRTRVHQRKRRGVVILRGSDLAGTRSAA